MPNLKVTHEEKLQAILEYLNEDISKKVVKKTVFLKLRFKPGKENTNLRVRMD